MRNSAGPFEGGRLRKRLAEAAKAHGPAAPSYAEVIPPEAADLLTLDWPSVVGHVVGSDETLCLSRYGTSHPDAPADRRAEARRDIVRFERSPASATVLATMPSGRIVMGHAALR